MLKTIEREKQELTRDMRRRVIIAGVGYYRRQGSPLAIGVVHDDENVLLGIPLRRATPLELRREWPHIVRLVHEDLLEEELAEAA